MPTPTWNDRSTKLTDEQLEQSALGPKFDAVTPAQIFGPAADGALAQRVYSLNPKRYRQLRQEFAWASGFEKRPENFYD